MHFQIDALPEQQHDTSLTSFKINMYIDGICYPLLASADTVENLKENGLMHQVSGIRRSAKGIFEEFEYPNKIDSTGVQYTSTEFNLVMNSPLNP